MPGSVNQIRLLLVEDVREHREDTESDVVILLHDVAHAASEDAHAL